MLVNECDPLPVHDIGCHTEQQIKRNVLHILPSPHVLPVAPHFLEPALSSTMGAALICTLYSTNEQFLIAYLMVFVFLPRFFYSPHLPTESLYGDATDKPLLDCCACGTAKYRVTFYGNWSEKIHPKDYPRKHRLLCLSFMPPQLYHTPWEQICWYTICCVYCHIIS